MRETQHLSTWISYVLYLYTTEHPFIEIDASQNLANGY